MMTHFRQIKPVFLLIALGLSVCILNYANSFADIVTEAEPPIDQILQSLIEEAGKLYMSKYREVEQKADELFGVKFSEYGKNFQLEINQLNLKISLIEKLQNIEERNLQMQLLEKEYENSNLLQYMYTSHYIQNEIAKDHLFVGKYLSILEEVVEKVIQKDPIFRYILLSDEFQKRQGLILTRVVWQTDVYYYVSAVTHPLNLHTVFANKAKIPMLIRITPNALVSLSSLRSILIHELNHVYMYRDPVFSDIRKFSGHADAPLRSPFTSYLKTLNPFSPSYQYHLIHEYYSLKAQLMFDEIVEKNPFYKLDENERKNLEQILAWVYSQLNKENKRFIELNPTPPIFKTVQNFYSCK